MWVLDPNGQPYQYCTDARTFAVQPGEFSVRVRLAETEPDFKQKWGINHIKALSCEVYVDGVWMDSKWVKGSPYEHTYKSKVILTPKGVEEEHKMVLVKPEASLSNRVTDICVVAVSAAPFRLNASRCCCSQCPVTSLLFVRCRRVGQ